MAVLFFYSAVSKMGGGRLEGRGRVWRVFTTDEHYHPLMLSLFASRLLAGQFCHHMARC